MKEKQLKRKRVGEANICNGKPGQFSELRIPRFQQGI
jgi:hypothetical protein